MVDVYGLYGTETIAVVKINRFCKEWSLKGTFTEKSVTIWVLNCLGYTCLVRPIRHYKWASTLQNLQHLSDQRGLRPACVPRNLIRVLADRMCLLQPLGYPRRGEEELSPYWVDIQNDLSLWWSHRSYCSFCRALVEIFYKSRNGLSDYKWSGPSCSKHV